MSQDRKSNMIIGRDWHYSHIKADGTWVHLSLLSDDGEQQLEIVWPDSTFRRMLDDFQWKSSPEAQALEKGGS